MQVEQFLRPVQGASSHAESIFRHKLSFPMFIIAALIVLFVCISIALVWGISMLVGLIFLGYAGIVLLLGRGMHIDYTSILFAVMGIAFIMLSMAGITFGTVDFSQFEIARSIYSIFN